MPVNFQILKKRQTFIVNGVGMDDIMFFDKDCIDPDLVDEVSSVVSHAVF